MQLVISHYTSTSSAGIGLAAQRESLDARRTGLQRNNFAGCDLDTWIGRIGDVESVRLPEALQYLHSRNNQLAWLALQQDGFIDEVRSLSASIGADRCGIVMGTSTSSIGRTEEAYTALDDASRMTDAYRIPQVHNLHSPGLLVAAATGLGGPSLTISTACSSSAKVFATAARWLRHGLVDAVLVGGADSLCLSTLYGFNSLELVSSEQCRPFDRNRDGINLGEAAGYALVTRQDLAPDARVTLLGYGESSDAYHMSHPHPEGQGAILAMDAALARAGLAPESVDYINLHGTASKANDAVETQALAQRFPTDLLASSTKAWTGHTLGAAGILESVIAMDTIVTGHVPGTLNCEQPDPEFPFPVLTENVSRPVRTAMTNSFGFGGNNCALVFGRNDV